MKSLLQFLFGKNPDIFDNNGDVRHALPKEKWGSWSDRYKGDEHNWRKHSGLKNPSKGPDLKPKV